jgi:adenine-specific DNA-methyltransferase
VRDELDVLLDRVADEALRADLREQVSRIQAKRTFGLVFESHLPERVLLPEHAVRRGVRVVRRDDSASPTFEVLAVRGGVATLRMVRHPDGSSLTVIVAAELVDERAQVEDLSVIADFGDPVHPGLRHLGSVRRGGDKPAHVVINGENHHALELLQFTHAGKVDCVYIDPPYNKGARDWKYDNAYVDADDAYRHSKWLAFMERRLNLTKQLLNPESSVLIVTIDETEYLRLGLLLEQMFAEATIQMVSSLVNPAYVARRAGFGRSDEYIFFVTLGEATPQRTRLAREWVSGKGRTHTGTARWDLLRRSGPGAARADSPGGFFPIYVDPTTRAIVEVGPVLGAGVSEAPEKPGLVAILPIRRNGTEGRWQTTRDTLMTRIADGRVRITGNRDRGFAVSYLKDGEFEKVLAGEYPTLGRRPDGSLDVGVSEGSLEKVITVPSTQWRVASHDATQYGSRLLASFVPHRMFPFPKSLYAVEDTTRFFVKNKPDAVVLDFFAGSGTTAHAVARLNRQDGGHRQSISVTNNEVSEAEAKSLRAQGHRPGDPEWEALGIFEHITRPRITAAVTGKTPEGDPIKGDYKFTDEFPMADGFEENVEFFELTYLDVDDVELDRAFAGIAPLLWLRAGGTGSVIEDRTDDAGEPTAYVWTARYGVLFDPDGWRGFVSDMPNTATAAFVVTDSQSVFAGIAAELPPSLEVVRLYENYLSTFATRSGR